MKPYWQRYNDLRRAVYLRDRGRCQMCGIDVKTGPTDSRGHSYEIHHRTPRSEGGRDRAENMEVRCIPCHKKETAEMHHWHKKQRAFLPVTNETRPTRTDRATGATKTTTERQRTGNTMGLVQNYQPVSSWFKADDIENGEVILTIKQIGEFTFDDGRTQPTLSFHETEKQLGLNKTNREKLAEIFGTVRGGVLDVEPHELIGQKIACYRASTQNREGATVPCVRIRQVRANAQPAPSASFTAPAPAAEPAPLTNGQMRGIIDQLQGAGRDAGIDVGRPDGPGDFGTWRNAAIRAIEAAKSAPSPAADAGNFWDDEDGSDPFADS